MSTDTERDPDKMADPPDNTGGGGRADLDSTDDAEKQADPPDNTGGGGKTGS